MACFQTILRNECHTVGNNLLCCSRPTLNPTYLRHLCWCFEDMPLQFWSSTKEMTPFLWQPHDLFLKSSSWRLHGLMRTACLHMLNPCTDQSRDMILQSTDRGHRCLIFGVLMENYWVIHYETLYICSIIHLILCSL